MISAQNHLQLLNGNKLLGLFIIPLMLISCGAFKKTQPVAWPDDDVIVVNPDKNTPKKDDPVKDDKDDKDEETLVYSMVTFKGEQFKVPISKSKTFEIAILLPFHSDNTNSSKDKRRADLMLEYYQGIRLAIPEIENLESKFSLRFYDTDNDTTKLKNILMKPELGKMDLIIGPTSEDQLKIAAYFARKREIPLFSPLTTMEKLWSNNPYVYNLNPSDQMKAMEFLDYFKKHHKDEKLLIVRDGKRFDKSFGKALVNECIAQKIDFSKVAYNQYLTWNDFLGSKKTVVLHTSENKTAMNYAVSGLLSRADDVTLVGSDEWMDFSSVDYKQLERLKITFISTYKAQTPNDMSKAVQKDYRMEYNNDPSWYTYMGHDQVLFACEILDAFGSYFPLFIEGKTVSYANTDFTLKKTNTCFQNKYLEIFQLRDMELKIVE
jgi:ABC-type branched-subunit amino acid transport system substrate-binding protein